MPSNSIPDAANAIDDHGQHVLRAQNRSAHLHARLRLPGKDELLAGDFGVGAANRTSQNVRAVVVVVVVQVNALISDHPKQNAFRDDL